jgi:hypothetical protein
VSSLVHELQRDALDSAVPVPDLLRKALVVARKLGVGEFAAWAGHELAGYPDDVEAPPYREIRGEVKAYNGYHRRWIAVVVRHRAFADRLARRTTRQSVAALEDLLRGMARGGMLQMPFSDEMVDHLMADGELPFVPTLIVQRTAIAAILDSVRTTVLNWALRLEEDGITGEGMSFSSDERRRAAEQAAAHVYNVNNFHGDVTGAQIQQGTTASAQNQSLGGVDAAALAAFVEQVRAAVPALPLAEAARDDLLAELDVLAAQAASKRPRPAAVRESLRTLRNLVEGAGGSLIASGILAEAAKLLGS